MRDGICMCIHYMFMLAVLKVTFLSQKLRSHEDFNSLPVADSTHLEVDLNLDSKVCTESELKSSCERG